VIRRISDLVYKIRIGKREVNLHVEQLKLCRASREELREGRRQHQRRMRYQRPQPEILEDTDSDSESSTASEGSSLHSFAAYENRHTYGSNNDDSPSITAEEERSAESPERHGTSETGCSESALATDETRALDGGRHGYSLRPRAKRNYKE
jgi:hypothetical protein